MLKGFIYVIKTVEIRVRNLLLSEAMKAKQNFVGNEHSLK